MEQVGEQACKTANKVALSIRYADTTGERRHAKQMFDDACKSVCALLDRLNPVELREWYGGFENVFAKSNSTLIKNEQLWTDFLGTQCDHLHRIGLHQKTIEEVGNQMAVWNRSVTPFSQLGNALDELSLLVGEESGKLYQVIDQQFGRETSAQRRSRLFSLSVCGLAIVVVSIDQAILRRSPRDESLAALANFGASLTVTTTQELMQACQAAMKLD
jgi:hypothetical protein